jgi:hypothetical protein
VTPPSTSHPDAGQPLHISSDHFFAFLSVLTTFPPELSESNGQNR